MYLLAPFDKKLESFDDNEIFDTLRRYEDLSPSIGLDPFGRTDNGIAWLMLYGDDILPNVYGNIDGNVGESTIFDDAEFEELLESQIPKDQTIKSLGFAAISGRTPGYGIFRGRVACDCLIEWLPVYEQKLVEAGVIKKNIDIAQLTGGAAASAGTHSQGGAYDIWQSSWTALKIADEMGAVSWGRTRAQGFAPHQHGILRGCPHNGPARYQITAADAGYNGLGYAGRGGRDDGPKPRSKRTWKQGIEWAEEDMPLSDSDINKIVKALKAELFEADVIPIQEPVGTEESRKANPNWKVSSVLSTLLREVVRTRDMVSEQKNPGSDVVPGKAQS